MTNVPLIIALSGRATAQIAELIGLPLTSASGAEQLLADRTVAELLSAPRFAPASVDLACAGELVDEAVRLLAPEIGRMRR